MDNLGVLALLALLPILVVGTLLLVFRWPARTAMPVGLAVVVVIALFAWKMSLVAVGASIVQGLLIAIGLLWIIFGALLMLETLTKSGALQTIRAGFTTISTFLPECSPTPVARMVFLTVRCWSMVKR